jgi:hypothetical protein
MSVGLHSQSVNVSRLTLLSSLRSNLEKHKHDYTEAVINYRLALQADLTTALVQANDPNSRLDKIRVDFSHPQSYASQYQQVIDMLEYSVDETINLDSQAFRAYVKDEWSWKGSFELISSTYAAKASTFSGARGAARG